MSVHSERLATPNDPKLSDGGGWRGPCMAGGKAAAETRAVTAVAVRLQLMVRRITRLLLSRRWRLFLQRIMNVFDHKTTPNNPNPNRRRHETNQRLSGSDSVSGSGHYFARRMA